MVLNKFKPVDGLARGLEEAVCWIIMSKKCVMRLSFREEGYTRLALYLVPSFPNA